MRFIPIRTYWSLAKSVFVTFYISGHTVVRSFFGPASREKSDQLLRMWASKLFKYVDLTYEVEGLELLEYEENRAYIIMSNHASAYDIPLIYNAMPGSIRMIAKKELFKFPIWGRGMEAAEFISIDRKDRVQAVKDLERAKEEMEAGIIIWIAPEGTRTRTGELLPFKKGAFMLAMQMNAIIIPVGLIGTLEVMKPDSMEIQYNRKVKVKVGEPIDVSIYELKERAKLMKDVREKIQSLISEES